MSDADATRAAPEIDRQAFDYLLRHDVAGLMDSLCQRLITERPPNPLQGATYFLNAKRCGDYSGGCAVLGSMSSGCWLRVFDVYGSPLVSFDRLPIVFEGYEIQMMTGCSKENALFVAAVMGYDEFKSKHSAASTVIDDTSSNTFILKLDLGAGGKVVASYDLGKTISSVSCLREKNQLWVTFKSGGGVLMQCSNGTILKELSLPACQGILFHGHSAIGLTAKSIEWRDIDSLQLETVSHLPDSMVKACSFVANQRHVWCTSANVDGSANFIGVFDFLAKSVSFLPPPTAFVAPDVLRGGGCWHLARTANGHTLTFTSEKGTKVMTIDAPKFKKGHVVVDKGSGALWIWRLDENGEGRITLFDPMQLSSIADADLPIGVSGNLCMIALY